MKRYLLSVLILAATGCRTSTFKSEGNQWKFTDNDLVLTAWSGFSNEGPILAGTRICPEVDYMGDTPKDAKGNDLFGACTTQAVDGGVVQADGDALCFSLDLPGPVTLSVTPQVCPANDQGFVPRPDRFLFQVVGPDAVRATVEQWPEVFALAAYRASEGESFPPDLLNPEGEVFRVMAGQEVLLFVKLVTVADGTAVAWRGPDGGLSLVPATAATTTSNPTAGWITMRLAEGATADLQLRVGDHTWVGGKVQAVDARAPASLTLVPAYQHDDEKPFTKPAGIRAVVRDKDGHAIYGVPVQWTVAKGPLDLVPGPNLQEDNDNWLPGADYAFLSDACIPPWKKKGKKKARIEASYGTLSATADLVWVPARKTEPKRKYDWKKPEECAK